MIYFTTFSHYPLTKCHRRRAQCHFGMDIIHSVHKHRCFLNDTDSFQSDMKDNESENGRRPERAVNNDHCSTAFPEYNYTAMDGHSYCESAF